MRQDNGNDHRFRGRLPDRQPGRTSSLDRLRTSWHAIRTSPEVRKLASEAVMLAEATVRRAASGGLGETASGVRGLIAGRAASRQGQRAA